MPGCTPAAHCAFVSAPAIQMQVAIVPPMEDVRAASLLMRFEVIPTKSGKKNAAPTIATAYETIRSNNARSGMAQTNAIDANCDNGKPSRF